jgi:hypothetical protein
MQSLANLEMLEDVSSNEEYEKDMSTSMSSSMDSIANPKSSEEGVRIRKLTDTLSLTQKESPIN